VVYVHGMYMLHSASGLLSTMKHPWSSFLPGDRVAVDEYSNIKLIYRKPRDVEAIVYKTHNRRPWITIPEYPYFRSQISILFSIPNGTIVKVNLTEQGGLLFLGVVNYPKLLEVQTNQGVSPPPSPQPHEGLSMPQYISL
jgi:hypothetical protein